MATNPMEEDSLIRALEDEQQFGVAPEAPPIPEEIIAQRNHSDDIETCVSSITDAIRDGELYVEPMYPVPEEGAPQPMVLDVAAERTHPHGNSKPSPRIVETNEQEVASLAATNPVEVAKGVHSAEIDKLSDEGEEDCKVEQPKAEEIVLVGEDSDDKEHLLQTAVEVNEAAKLEKLTKNIKGDEAAGQEEAANTAVSHGQDPPIKGNNFDAQGNVLPPSIPLVWDQPLNDPAPSFLDIAALTERQDTVPGNTVEAVAEVESVQQPGLYRTTLMNPQSEPGAFMGAPGRQMQRNPNLDYGLLGANNLVTEGGPENSSAGTAVQILTNEGLVQANAIEDDTADLMHANPVDLEEAAQHRALQRKQQQKTFLAAVLWLLLVAAIIVGFVAGTQKNTEPKVVVLESTEAPTVYGSVEPSEVPSSAPTGALDLLLDGLPDYTLASINKGSETPQWRALNWLANHQNITYLSEWRKSQLFALATFFYSFEGENWYKIKDRGWMDDTVKECDWFSSLTGFFIQGIYYDFQSFGIPYTPPCNNQGQFTHLDLRDLQLSGLSPSIPPEIALLTSLSLVDLLVNDIAGPISSLLPTELYEMTGLTHLDLGANQFTGRIPSEISLLTSLTYLGLVQNQLTGHLPSEFGLLTLLSDLWLAPNRITGPVPSELCLMTSLVNLILYMNRLSGTLPSEVGLLTSLETLSLYSNQFTGPIPSELGLLISLNELFVSTSLLSGQVPSELGLLTSLEWSDLSYNQHTGLVPSDLGLLTSLGRLFLSSNQLTSQFPSELGLLTSLRELELSANQLSGQIPTEVGMMTSLTSLALHNNNLTGTLPIQLNASMELRLDGNQFSGTVPEHLCSFLLCDCSLNETPSVSTCAGLEAQLYWPGLFPNTSPGVMLNIYIDEYPEETSWLWQKETNVTGIWDTLESGGPLEDPWHVYSYLLSARPRTSTDWLCQTVLVMVSMSLDG